MRQSSQQRGPSDLPVPKHLLMAQKGPTRADWRVALGASIEAAMTASSAFLGVTGSFVGAFIVDAIGTLNDIVRSTSRSIPPRPNLTINGTIKTRPGKAKYRKVSPKSDASVRTVVLPDFAAAVLKHRQATARENPNDAVFPTRNGHLATGQRR